MTKEKEDYYGNVDLAEKEEEELKHPQMYKILLHNDDYTPMDFVVSLVENIFRKSKEQSTQIMLKIHNDGIGLVGVYSSDIARTKQMQVQEMAKINEHPLMCTIEPEDDDK
jgi:ATP-dependent Clp protease adaptor protein ClpS